MNQRGISLILAAMAVSLALAGACAWVFGWWLQIDSALSSAQVVGTELLLAGALAGWVFARFTAQWRKAQASLERLCDLNYRELSEDELAPQDDSSTTFDILQRVRQTLVRLSRQLREAEDARTALELRAQRGALEHERMQAVLGSLSDPALVLDEFGQIVTANDAAERLLGFRLADGANPPAVQLPLPQSLAEAVADAARRKVPATRSCDVECSDAGRERAYRVTVRNYAVRSRQGVEGESDRNGVVAVFRDMSSEREAGRRHAEFVSAVSHEMKAPLSGIKAYVELLADGDVTDEAVREEFLEVINGQAERLQRLIDNLLNLARIESGVVKVNKECRSLNELLQEALEVVRPSAEAKRISLKADFSPMYLNALVDRDQISQAAINLLSNAVKYTPEQGAVTLRSRSLDDKVQFDVEDTGVGLSPEDCQRIFEKFYRVRSHSQMAPGTGLGLPLAKSIVEEVHGGILSVKSQLGKGSTFTVTLASAGTMR